jgi:hypothetical protein
MSMDELAFPPNKMVVANTSLEVPINIHLNFGADLVATIDAVLTIPRCFLVIDLPHFPLPRFTQLF